MLRARYAARHIQCRRRLSDWQRAPYDDDIDYAFAACPRHVYAADDLIRQLDASATIPPPRLPISARYATTLVDFAACRCSAF